MTIRLTTSCTLVRNNDSFDLKVKYSDNNTTFYRNIDKLGWDKQLTSDYESILMHKKSVTIGWIYIFDAGDVTVKSWGIYSDKELALRSKELGIKTKFGVLPVDSAWSILK